METRRRSSKLPLILGGILLAIGVISAIISATSVSSLDKPQDVSAGKTYYLLGDKSSINAQNCALKSENDTTEPPVSLISNSENKIPDDGKIKDISLPLTPSKGVVVTMEFSKDIKGLTYKCDTGQTYISSKSGSTLNVLRWLTMAGVLAGLLLILSSYIPRKKDESQEQVDADEHHNTTGNSYENAHPDDNSYENGHSEDNLYKNAHPDDNLYENAHSEDNHVDRNNEHKHF